MKIKLEIGRSETFTVFARKIFNNSGIHVEVGERYRFIASGNWTDLVKKSSANGYSNFYMRLFNRWKRFKGAKWFALIGSIDQTHDFFVGSASEIVIDTDGMLSFYANDVRSFYWNNFGEVQLEITRLE